MEESVKEPTIEIIEGGDRLSATLAHERGTKRPLSPPTLPGDDNDSSKPTSEDDDGDWSVSGSEAEDEDHENKGIYPPYTVDDIPRPTCNHDHQSDILYHNPDAELRGPLPIRLFPAFRSAKHVFGSDYNLGDKSEISASNVGDCSSECLCLSMDLLQFIDVRLAGYRHSCPGYAKIFGFVAARETIEPSLRNYVYKREIGNCETVSVNKKTGVARLTLTSPTRVISMMSRALVEFELHALSEDEKGGHDDLIIEGCTEFDHVYEPKSFIESRRLYSDKCALDIKYAVLLNAVEARVNIEVLRVPSHGVDLKVHAKTSGFHDIIHLFKGVGLEVGFTRSFAVAVVMNRSLDLYIKGSPRDDHALSLKPLQGSWRGSCSSDLHGTVEELVVELGDFAEISVKVTWKTYSKRPC